MSIISISQPNSDFLGFERCDKLVHVEASSSVTNAVLEDTSNVLDRDENIDAN